MNANTPLTTETTGYPTQKPEALLERVIRAASGAGGAVLDPMCGSGTTVAVAVRLGRRALGIDQSPVACQIARARLATALARHGTGPGIESDRPGIDAQGTDSTSDDLSTDADGNPETGAGALA
jgi:hypothetical protein